MTTNISKEIRLNHPFYQLLMKPSQPLLLMKYRSKSMLLVLTVLRQCSAVANILKHLNSLPV